MQFTNISVETIFYERFWWGAAEPIHITAMPRDISTTVRSPRPPTGRHQAGTQSLTGCPNMLLSDPMAACIRSAAAHPFYSMLRQT